MPQLVAKQTVVYRRMFANYVLVHCGALPVYRVIVQCGKGLYTEYVF